MPELKRRTLCGISTEQSAIFWKSADALRVQAAFLREYDCPTDGASGGLLIDDLCHALTGEKSCYIFIDDFHLLTDKRAPIPVCALAGRLPPNVHFDFSQP